MSVTGPWFCDTCGKPIAEPKDGMVQWLRRNVDGRMTGRDLRIVHHLTKSPVQGAHGCYANKQGEYLKDGSILADVHVHEILTPDGLERLLSLIKEGELPAPEVNRIIMRLFVPNYERLHRRADRAISQRKLR